MHPRNATHSMEGQNATAAEPLGTISQKRCSDQHLSSSAVHQRRAFALCPVSPSRSRCIGTPKLRSFRCQRAGMSIGPNSTWLLAAVLTRATHERALIGHREPDSGRSHGFFRTIDGGIAIEALMAALRAAPGPPALDLVPAAPHRWLARTPMLMGVPIIIFSMNSIPHRCENGSATPPSEVVTTSRNSSRQRR